jgi:hypothetical protein
MRLSWLGTTAVALVIGSGAVIAQSQTEQKREEGPRPQQNQYKDTDRPSADERAKKDRTVQPDPKGGAKEQQRGEGPGDRRQQAQEPPRDNKQPSPEVSQDQQKGRDAKQPDSKQQQGQQGQTKENQARDAKQPEPKQQSQPVQPKPDNQARDAKQPADTKQQQGQQQPTQQPSGQQRGQTAQPSTSTPQQTTPSATGQTGQQTTGRSSDSSRPAGPASTNVNDQQRSQIVDRLRRDRSVSRQNIDIQVSIGERLPPRARLQRLPPDIVRIAPQYRGYEYTVVEDRVYVVEPRTRRVIDVISESGPSTRTTSTFRSGGGERVVIAQEQRETFKQVARRGMTSAPTSASPGSLSDQSCPQLQAVPEELVRKNPELGQYRYLTIGEQILLIDPRQQKVVEVID